MLRTQELLRAASISSSPQDINKDGSVSKTTWTSADIWKMRRRFGDRVIHLHLFSHQNQSVANARSLNRRRIFQMSALVHVVLLTEPSCWYLE
jgi:hypothetical protein